MKAKLLLLLCLLTLPKSAFAQFQSGFFSGEMVPPFLGYRYLDLVEGNKDCRLAASVSSLTRWDCIVTDTEIVLRSDSGERRFPVHTASVWHNSYYDEFYWDYLYVVDVPESDLFTEPTKIQLRVWYYTDFPAEKHVSFEVPQYSTSREVYPSL